MTDNMYTRVAEVELSYHPTRCARPKVEDSSIAANLFYTNWDDGRIEFRESVKVMLLNNAQRCMGISTIADGGTAQCSLDVKTVLQAALLGNARGIILCHNHPSGNLKPSAQDDDITRRIKHGCEAIGVRLSDHIILSPDEGEYYSYKDNCNIL